MSVSTVWGTHTVHANQNDCLYATAVLATNERKDIVKPDHREFAEKEIELMKTIKLQTSSSSSSLGFLEWPKYYKYRYDHYREGKQSK